MGCHGGLLGYALHIQGCFLMKSPREGRGHEPWDPTLHCSLSPRLRGQAEVTTGAHTVTAHVGMERRVSVGCLASQEPGPKEGLDLGAVALGGCLPCAL